MSSASASASDSAGGLWQVMGRAYAPTPGCPKGLQGGLRFVSLPPSPCDDRAFRHPA